MGRIFDKPSEATAFPPVADQTLEWIVAHEAEEHAPGITWQELALFNWGSDDPSEVNRALCEHIGVKTLHDEPQLTVLDPARGPSGVKQLLLPKAWQAPELEAAQSVELALKAPVPAPAIAITELSRWFIPETESCDIEYRLAGDGVRADKVALAVQASHYCKAVSAKKGELLEYTFSPCEVPVYEKVVGEAAPRTPLSIDDWKGESTASDGVLKPRPGGKRHINVACSPYTVTLRYYKEDADLNAAIELQPLWPQFDDAQAPVEASLEVNWTLKNGAKLKHGMLQILDKAGEPVYTKGLDAADLASGKHPWEGGAAVAKPENMPYRVQIQAHSEADEAAGLALAVMHTEVRLCAHPDLGADADDPLKDPQSLELGLAPWQRKAEAPAKGSTRWYKLKLAAAGFHPGPISDDAADPDYKRALAEFQRSYPKEAAAPFTRLEAKGDEGPDTEAALERLAADARPLFGDPASRADHSHDAAEGRLKDKDAALITWVDDRHGFTNEAGLILGWLGKDTVPAGQDAMKMEGVRGTMDAGDGRVAQDADTICRPWIPVQVAFPLLSKGSELDAPAIPKVTDAMRRATGPLRIDWTFSELGEDLSVIDAAAYSHDRARPRACVDTIVQAKQAVHKTHELRNCPEDLGGIRPSTVTDYFKAPFGLAERSLQPWLAEPDAATETICSYVHDDLGQAEDDLLVDAVGRAGVYLQPSRIAGDGYRFRARLSFAQHPGGKDHPNREVLAARYPRLPQVHTATLRNWRKTSFRGYVRWAAAAGNRFEDAVNQRYKACHLHFVHEAGAAQEFALNTLISEAEFKDLVADFCDKAEFQRKAEMRLSTDYVWPWGHQKHFGINTFPAPGQDFEAAFMPSIQMSTWKRFRIPLIHLLLHKIEKLHGLLRGHLVVEMDASPRAWTQRYACDTCTVEQFLLESTAVGNSAHGDPCHVTACGGHLQGFLQRQQYGCFTCGKSVNKFENAGNPYLGTPCPTRCDGVINESGLSAFGSLFSKIAKDNHNVTYSCSKCSHKRTNLEPTANPPALAGQVCGHACAGTLAQTPGGATTQANIAEIRFASKTLGLPAVGTSLSTTWVFRGDGSAATWAHEIGHHRQLEHAASGPGFQVSHHDSAANPLPAIAGAAPDDRRWDRCCIMSYTKDQAPDNLCFCGKCVLKNRGWKVEALAHPASAVSGP